MVARKMRAVLLALGTAVLGAAPSQSDACCFWRSMTTANYAPVAVPACNTCNYAPAPVCNTCNYVPQVAYRTVYTNVPVTVMRPISTVNPCTGCPVTTLQPTTSYRLQPQLVPYTTYRPVATSCCAAPTTVSYAPACPTGACGGCATGACGTAVAPAATTYYAPSYPAATVPAPATPGCCGGGGTFAPASASTYAPAISPSYASATNSPYIPAAQPGNSASATSTPSLSPSNTYNNSTPSPPSTGPSNSSPPRTFQESPSNSNPPNFSPTPIPDANTSTGATRSNMVLPRKQQDLGDLTTSNTVNGSSAVYRQTAAKIALPSSSTVDDGGWRAAR